MLREPQKQTTLIHELLLSNASLKGRLIRIKKQNQKGASQIFVIQEY